MMIQARFLILPFFLMGTALFSGCFQKGTKIDLDGQDVELVFLHTADIHSRLIPYDMKVLRTDQDLGLLQDNAPFGGIARLSTVARQLRADNPRFMHVDTGDVFQGGPIFNVFSGEPEFRALSQIGLDVMAIGNHEFDNGANTFVSMAESFAQFPLLASNWLVEDPNFLGGAPTGRVAEPFSIINLNGLSVGVIGLGNLSSMTSIFKGNNSHGITPLETVSTLQQWVDFIRPMVDLVITVGHLGYHENLEFVPRITGVDIVFDGHLHIALDPPAVIKDCDIAHLKRERDRFVCNTPEKLELVSSTCETSRGCDQLASEDEKTACKTACQQFAVDSCKEKTRHARLEGRLEQLNERIAFLENRGCHPRDVVIVHSGAFLKYGGVLRAIVRQCDRLEEKDVCVEKNIAGVCTKTTKRRCVGKAGGRDDWEVVSHDFKLIPLDKNIPEDPMMLQMMEPYTLALNRQEYLTQVMGFAAAPVKRFPVDGSDSPLGNLLADGILSRNQVWADVGMTNSLGIRSDISPGPIHWEEMFNVFPFENYISMLYVSGREIQELFDFITGRSASRGCKTQAQVSGVSFTMNCVGCVGDGGNRCSSGNYNGEACAQRITVDGTGEPCLKDDDCSGGEICTGQEHPIESEKRRCGLPISCDKTYRLATNDYLAGGGSGFQVLGRNTTQVTLDASLRQTAADFMRAQPSCAEAIPREIVKDSKTGKLKATRTFVISEADEVRLKEAETMVLAGDTNKAKTVYNTLRAEWVKQEKEATNKRVRDGLRNYLACSNPCVDNNGNKIEGQACIGLAHIMRERCDEYKYRDPERCKTIADISAAKRCITLPCIAPTSDGRIEIKSQGQLSGPQSDEI